ncbi:2-C-methyl-D-erythritol 4-phosphate cytidylyltransferase [Lottiidibacillus patelloidae]|uniref:2-C-methyl-D-erythritol 4-phosphate cytidylyltransferase n=1 Tax=Lottiidibacillus patelloidae TaxID=2670334 RepID=A0A263BQ73_9BACI|nr:2-C-methyl-D-erythritol 4-phosphate cytidylyltransferase [Lottiidibacillus patelloidae]OZM55879.1 2-C-methyl-D-erythritol 4-phosphate cytidylyltransferase [Lottiidibacillus patelloidae]
MEYQVIVPAAGQGKRMQAGKNKQFLLLENKPVLIHTLSIFEEDEHCKGIIVVANKAEINEMESLFSRYKLAKIKAVIEGGSERQHSVYNGLKALPNDNSIVFVHDGARPFVTKESFLKLTRKASEVGAAVLAVQVKDTIKKVTDSKVTETVDRSSLWAIQTPQAFRISLLKEAHEYAKKEAYIGTDDASLVEKIGREVAIVEGDYKNIKLTTPDDLLYANMILEERKK